MMDGSYSSLNPEATDIIDLIQQLRKSLRFGLSFDWEREYRSADLAEKVARLEAELENCLPCPDRSTRPRQPRSALDAARDKEMEVLERAKWDLQRRAEDMDSRLRDMTDRLGDVWSENWQLTYQYDDLREEVWRLKAHLRNSIPSADAHHSQRQPRTALEAALEHRIGELETARRLNPKGRARSKTM